MKKRKRTHKSKYKHETTGDHCTCAAYIAEIIQALTLFGALIAQFFFSYEIKEVENG